MSNLADSLRTITGESGSLLFVLVFVIVFVAVAAIGLHVMRPTRSIGISPSQRRSGFGTGRRALGSVDASSLERPRASSAAAPESAEAAGKKTRPSLRSVLGTIHSGLSILILGFLLMLTVAAYLASSPHDGSLLVPLVLLVVTAMVAMKLSSAADRLRESESDVALSGDLRESFQADLAAKIGAALAQGKVQWQIASPEVHSMDSETLARAQSMAAEGIAIDEICQAVEPEYAGWSEAHRQAYQSVVRAAIAHGNSPEAL